jgi:hypothetical protein
MHLNVLEKEEQAKPKSNCWKEIVTIRAEINRIGTKYNLLVLQKDF